MVGRALYYIVRVHRKLGFVMEFWILYIQYNSCIRVQSSVDEIIPVCSIISTFSSPKWWEQKVWDMFGVYFSNHPDLHCILIDYNFEGHPL
jgi:NADH:ubiquinone oxidoreductase subunit C